MPTVLVIYANSDPVMRESVKALLHSFERHLVGCQVFYHNSIFNRSPFLATYREVDCVIFHHSVTTVWNRSRYRKKLERWLATSFGGAKKIALMQDEYKNVDLLREFVSQISFDRVFTLAPPSQWVVLYGNDIVKSGVLQQYLAGYIDQRLISTKISKTQTDFHHEKALNRSIDIGYRADWSKMHVKLGKTGLLKRDIASVCKSAAVERGLSVDIEIGARHFISGAGWHSFMQNCRYMLGVPSGSSVLDYEGLIESSLLESLKINPQVSEQNLYEEIVASYEQSLFLEVLSPRHFEAMLNGCGQILIESEYNGLLKAWEHYLPLKRDFSNLSDIVDASRDESLRLKIVGNCQRDIIGSELFTYEKFVGDVVGDLLDARSQKVGSGVAKRINRQIESMKMKLLFLRSQVNRLLS